ncbi:hypothetical protein CoNPh26_CDS0032 [Staphylococcus phage S-CoN_Ph26]|nr:hypothetical protein CoNPh26_CDS0032 [Staphylococcus phage S-CoN_Ph26]
MSILWFFTLDKIIIVYFNSANAIKLFFNYRDVY